MKGQQLIIFGLFLLFSVVIVFASIRISLPLLGEAQEFDINIRKDFYTVSNAFEAADIYLRTASKYAVYQSCYDSLKAKNSISSETIFLHNIDLNLRSNLDKYTKESYRFLDYDVDFSGFSTAFETFCSCGDFKGACHESEDLRTLRVCMENKMKAEGIDTGQVTTFEGEHSCEPSYHFGGPCAGIGIGSLAVDYGLGGGNNKEQDPACNGNEAKYGDRVIQIAKECGAETARCEAGSETAGCSTCEADHVHIEAKLAEDVKAQCTTNPFVVTNVGVKNDAGFIDINFPKIQTERIYEDESESLLLENKFSASSPLVCFEIYRTGAEKYAEIYDNVYAAMKKEIAKWPESLSGQTDCEALFRAKTGKTFLSAAEQIKSLITSEAGTILKNAEGQGKYDIATELVSTNANFGIKERVAEGGTITCTFSYDIEVNANVDITSDFAYPVFNGNDILFEKMQFKYSMLISSVKGQGNLGPQTPYDSIIQAAGQLFGADQTFIKAIIRKESDFNPEAHNTGSGAKGLMQLTRVTIEDITTEGLPSHKFCEKKGFVFTTEYIDYNSASIFNPEKNIYAGVCYFSYLIDRYGDSELALAAYNAGPAELFKWRDCIGNQAASWDQIVSGASANNCQISQETLEYVSRVTRFYDIYSNLA